MPYCADKADNMPSDGAQLKIMLDNLNAQEEAMTQMFSGTCNKEEKNIHCPPYPGQGIQQ